VGIKQNHGQMEDVPILQIDKTKSRKMLYNVAAKKTKNKKKRKIKTAHHLPAIQRPLIPTPQPSL